MADQDKSTHCDFCGRIADSPGDALSWTTSVENNRSKTYCPDCSRNNLRSIEGKLDSEWW